MCTCAGCHLHAPCTERGGCQALQHAQPTLRTGTNYSIPYTCTMKLKLKKKTSHLFIFSSIYLTITGWRSNLHLVRLVLYLHNLIWVPSHCSLLICSLLAAQFAHCSLLICFQNLRTLWSLDFHWYLTFPPWYYIHILYCSQSAVFLCLFQLFYYFMKTESLLTSLSRFCFSVCILCKINDQKGNVCFVFWNGFSTPSKIFVTWIFREKLFDAIA